jgi:outer membrane protein W
MKRIVIVLLAIAIVSGAAMAGDMAKSGQWGVQSSFGAGNFYTSTVGLKFMASENLAVRFEAGFNSFSPGGSGSSTSNYGVGAGFEYHMTAVGDVSPYVGLGAGYSGRSIPNLAAGDSNPNYFDVKGYWGGEYFFSSNFSWAGQIGLDFWSYNSGAQGASSSTTITTSNATFIFSWYLN